MSRKADVIVIGGGQAGLATSRCLTRLGLDHIVLERGRIAQRWWSERWNSLHLLTPNWMTRLPDYAYQGTDPNGFMHKDEVARFLADYSRTISAPVMTQTRVRSVRHDGHRFHLDTDNGRWPARAVVVATGACDRPRVPSCASRVAPHIEQITLDRYKTPGQIETGGVLIIGASASGVQIASELLNAGHPVTLAAGQHTRLPRRYRGQDIMVWLDRCGILSQPRDHAAGPDKIAAQHSFQLVGGPDAASLDLMTFQSDGGVVTGRLSDAFGTRCSFQDTLPADVAKAEARQTKLLREIDRYIAQNGITVETASKVEPVQVTGSPTEIDLDRAGIKTIIWATGYRRDYTWLEIPVLSGGGEILQLDGITPVPGLYTMGLPGMRRRKSSFLDGVADDAHFIARQIALHLEQTHKAAA